MAKPAEVAAWLASGFAVGLARVYAYTHEDNHRYCRPSVPGGQETGQSTVDHLEGRGRDSFETTSRPRGAPRSELQAARRLGRRRRIASRHPGGRLDRDPSIGLRGSGRLIAVDTNLLVYAHRRDSPWHPVAKACLAHLGEARPAWAIPWPCVHEFLSVVTHPRIYRPASTLEQACDQMEAWLESPTLELLGESAEHWPALRSAIEAGRVVGPRVHDARIAAICQQHGISELWSADRDFSRFGALAVRNPLVEAQEG